MQKIAKSINSVAKYIEESQAIIFYYKIEFSSSDIYEDELQVLYDCQDLMICDEDVNFLNQVFKIFLAQLFLSEKIRYLTCKDEERIQFLSILHLLWNIRSFEEGLSLPYGEIEWIKDKSISISDYHLEEKKILALISGGKDSLASDILLKKNGCKIQRCFCDGLNIKSNDNELYACKKLYPEFTSIKLIHFDRLINYVSQISDCLGEPPDKNLIPRGRDLLSIVFTVPIALAHHCRYIAHGCEKDLWLNNIISDDKIIPIHDSQSIYVVSAINKLLKIHYGMGTFSPIAGMHECYIFQRLYDHHFSKMTKIQSCFNGNWCGRCKKCFRYYLLQKRFGLEVIKFHQPPELLISHFSEIYKDTKQTNFPYFNEMRYLLGLAEPAQKFFEPTYDSLYPYFFTEWDL